MITRVVVRAALAILSSISVRETIELKDFSSFLEKLPNLCIAFE